MQINEALLKIISNDTMDAINGIQVVTPSLYKSYFDKHARHHNTEMEDEEKITNIFLDAKIQMYHTFQEQNSKNAILLSDTTTKAISAIENKDENVLHEVLKETRLLRQEIEKLKEAVYTDELTQAKNRKWMHDHFLAKENDTFTQEGVLAIIDLNFFKEINDTHGHVVGDKVLIYLSKQLASIKENIIRYGGDEFIILFKENINATDALKKLTKIREELISKKLKTAKASFRLSFSIGIASFTQGDSLTDIIELADKKMYADKIQIKKRITGID